MTDMVQKGSLSCSLCRPIVKPQIKAPGFNQYKLL